MILTGKAKEDFLKNQYKESLLNDFDLESVSFIFNILPLNHQYSDIIEWLEGCDKLNGHYSFENIFYREYRNTSFKNRKEATEKAIIHANKIYNEKMP